MSPSCELGVSLLPELRRYGGLHESNIIQASWYRPEDAEKAQADRPHPALFGSRGAAGRAAPGAPPEGASGDAGTDGTGPAGRRMPFIEDPMTGGTAEVRRIQPFEARKEYVCPGCNQEIPTRYGPRRDRSAERHRPTAPLACSVPRPCTPARDAVSLVGAWEGVGLAKR